jgi:hypothetical protein
LDRALFSLAAEGYACEGHTKLWERVYGQPTAVVEPPDPRTDDGSRAIEDEVGDFTTRGEQLISTTSPVIGQFVRALLAGATENLKASPFTDPVTRRAEPPEVTRAVGMAQVLALVYGGPESPVSPEGLAAINAFAPPVPDDAEGHVDMATAMDFALAIGNHAPSIEALANKALAGPVNDLVKGAQFMREWLSGYSPATWVPSLGDPEALDQLAGILAPLGAALSSTPLGKVVLTAADPKQWGTDPIAIIESLELPDSESEL